MKKYISAVLFAVIATTISCDSFLDDQPRGNAIAEKTDEYDGMFNTTFFMNMSMTDYTHWLNDDILLTQDCITNFPTTLGYYFNVNSVERAFRYEKSIYEVSENCTAWEKCYKNVYTYNVIANEVMNSSGGTEAEKKALQAEARISRAWMHFVLAQIFSKPYNSSYAETELTIPIVKEANSTQEEFSRATMKELYDFISTEMEESCPDLEDRNMHNMRVYKTTGYALLGKMYWMIGEYQKAIEPLTIAYERALQDNSKIFLQNFDNLQTKYGYRELTLSELRSEERTTSGYMLPYTYGDPEILWVKQNVSFSSLLYLYYYGLPTYYLKPSSYDLFDENDLRRNLILTKDDTGTPYPYPIGCIRDKSVNYGVDLAEIYLALAECEARAGSETKARTILEEFRTYRMRAGYEGIPTSVNTKDELIKFCVNEERREFMGKKHRYYNLRRLWNDPLFQDEKPISHSDGKNTYTMTEGDLYLQLPEGVLKWNESWR